MVCIVRGGHKESDTTEQLSLSASGRLPGQGHLPAHSLYLHELALSFASPRLLSYAMFLYINQEKNYLILFSRTLPSKINATGFIDTRDTLL